MTTNPDGARRFRASSTMNVMTCRRQAEGAKLMTIKDTAQIEWDEIRKIDHYALSVKDLAK